MVLLPVEDPEDEVVILKLEDTDDELERYTSAEDEFDFEDSDD